MIAMTLTAKNIPESTSLFKSKNLMSSLLAQYVPSAALQAEYSYWRVYAPLLHLSLQMLITVTQIIHNIRPSTWTDFREVF